MWLQNKIKKKIQNKKFFYTELDTGGYEMSYLYEYVKNVSQTKWGFNVSGHDN